MAERNVVRFALVAGATLLVMTMLAQLLPEMLDIPPAYGIVVSGVGLAIILFSWHIWVQTSPGGIDLESYAAKDPLDRLTDFLIVAVVSGVVGAIGAVIGVAGGIIDPDVMWGGDTMSWVTGTIVVVVGMAVGIYAGLRRNQDSRIPRETGRGE